MPFNEGDAATLSAIKEEIARLNRKHGCRFFFFIRDRVYNASEKRYMSWERKGARSLNYQDCSQIGGADFALSAVILRL